MVKHYICIGGCGGVSDNTGTCKSEDCDNWGEEFEECKCADEKHENLGMSLPDENAKEE